MMRDNLPSIGQREQLDEILSRWHHHCKTFKVVRESGAEPMFRKAVSSKDWDSTSDIADDTVNAAQMKAVDFAVTGDLRSQGGMDEPYRSAIQILARNIYTGRSVWFSPRLPQDAVQRSQIIETARRILTEKLHRAGVL